ncbi:MAG: hypothetical protein QM655_07485 [Nocardioidaceae bacterium]
MPTVDCAAVLDREISVEFQPIAMGSWAELPFDDTTAAVTVHAWFWASMPASPAPQVVLSLGGAQRVSLVIRAGALSLVGPKGEFPVTPEIRRHEWYSVAVSVDRSSGAASVDLKQVSGILPVPGRWITSGNVGSTDLGGLRIATAELDEAGSPRQPYNGKLENPSIYAGLLSETEVGALHADGSPSAVVVAAWDFSRDQTTQVLRAAGGGAADGTLNVGGDRGVTSHSWDGLSDSFVQVPQHYAAVHFHEDDMFEAGWDYTFDFTLPADLESGVYAVKLDAGAEVDRYPLFVRGLPGSTAEVLFLLPTNTYLAYANDRLGLGDLSPIMGHEVVLPADEQYLHAHEELGRSCYDTHRDGSPCRYSSRRRPLVNVRPGYRNFLTGSYRHFPADMYTLEWIMRSGHSFQVATDEDVHREGDELFKRFKVVVTGGHPEYWTRTGRGYLDDYLRNGGRLMYLGGNGFYWVTTHDPERPYSIEVRRDNSGTRCWDAPPGERTHVYTGEPGGIWKLRGMGPNKLVGVGFSTEGFSAAKPFRRQPASYEGVCSPWFAGIDAEHLGEHGHILGAAAGDEVDRFDVALGSPEHGVLLATADGFGVEYQLVIEDQILALPAQGGLDRPDVVKADMVYLPIDGGGAVFSGSSIVYCGALAWNDFENDLCTVTNRVLDSFCGELPGSAPESTT